MFQNGMDWSKETVEPIALTCVGHMMVILGNGVKLTIQQNTPSGHGICVLFQVGYKITIFKLINDPTECVLIY